jgi:hypothetical protein
MSEHFKPLGAGLGSLFEHLERRVHSNVELADRVRAALPGPEKDHVVSATYRDDTLIVLADSAAWCTHVRYGQAQLLERLRAAGETRFTKLKVKVAGAGGPASGALPKKDAG